MSFQIMKMKSAIMQTYASSRECRRDIFISMVAIDMVVRRARFNIFSSPQAGRTVHKGNTHPACRDFILKSV